MHVFASLPKHGRSPSFSATTCIEYPPSCAALCMHFCNATYSFAVQRIIGLTPRPVCSRITKLFSKWSFPPCWQIESNWFVVVITNRFYEWNIKVYQCYTHVFSERVARAGQLSMLYYRLYIIYLITTFTRRCNYNLIKVPVTSFN
jgi:hypothetical protein